MKFWFVDEEIGMKDRVLTCANTSCVRSCSSIRDPRKVFGVDLKFFLQTTIVMSVWLFVNKIMKLMVHLYEN